MSEITPDDTTRGYSRDSVSNTLRVAVGLSLVCSILVAGTAVLLKPKQQRNEEQYRQRIILEVAGLMRPGAEIEDLFAGIEARIVDLETGTYNDEIDPGSFDTVVAANDPAMSVAVPPELDLGNIKRRAKYAPVYLVKEGDQVEQIILPVYGSGLWSTMFGYLALASDGTTVTGFRFYSHAETPGLGDQVDDPEWRQQWIGKRIYDADGVPRIEVIRGVVPEDSGEQSGSASYQVDGLSGATLTGRGVTNLLHYWTGPHGFGPYLENYWQAQGTSS